MAKDNRLARKQRVKAFQRLARTIGEEAARQGLTEEQLLNELKEDKRQVFEETYGDIPE